MHTLQVADKFFAGVTLLVSFLSHAHCDSPIKCQSSGREILAKCPPSGSRSSRGGDGREGRGEERRGGKKMINNWEEEERGGRRRRREGGGGRRRKREEGGRRGEESKNNDTIQ